MKQRIISLVVTNHDDDVLFNKCPCCPQDVLACLSLFEDDGVKVEVTFHDTDSDVPPVQD